MSNNKVLITGANGFVGQLLIQRLVQNRVEVYATGRGACRLSDELQQKVVYFDTDITNEVSVKEMIATCSPDAIVHLGALGKPDYCELHREEAYRTNVMATQYLGVAAREKDAYFLFLSSSMVFDGEDEWYDEDANLQPANFYGYTKAVAEKLLQELSVRLAIVRTVLVYGEGGNGNIYQVIKEKIKTGVPYKLVNDQWRTITYVDDLITGLEILLRRQITGVFHLCGKEVFSPYQLGMAICAVLEADQKIFTPVTAVTFSEIARRPLQNRLRIKKAEELLDYVPHTLEEVLRKLL